MKGITVTVEFGAIKVVVNEPEYNVNTDDIRKHSKVIKTISASAAIAAINVQNSLRKTIL